MCSKEKFRHLCPNFETPIKKLSAKEIMDQFLYLESGLADEKNPKGISLGLSKHLTLRRDELLKIIKSALETRNVLESAEA